MTESHTTKNGIPAGIRCLGPDDCDCPPGTCKQASVVLQNCSMCGARAAAFICDRPGCPVNGGAYYG